MCSVSVIIPLFNREKTIKRAIDSVKYQKSIEEIIVVDDCSKDFGPEIVRKLSVSDNRVKLIQLKENKGAAAARNIGVINAKSNYIAFLDSDDEWVEGKIEMQLEALKNNNDAVMVYRGYKIEGITEPIEHISL